MSKLIIVAQIIAKSNKINFVKNELLKLIKPTLLEKGCLQYDLHQDNDNPACFLYYESWQSQDDWSQHLNSVHLKQYASAVEGMVETTQINKMTLLS